MSENQESSPKFAISFTYEEEVSGGAVEATRILIPIPSENWNEWHDLLAKANGKYGFFQIHGEEETQEEVSQDEPVVDQAELAKQKLMARGEYGGDCEGCGFPVVKGRSVCDGCQKIYNQGYEE